MEKGMEITTDKVPKAADMAADWIRKNPGTAAGLAVGGAIIVAPAIVSVPVLAACGFGPCGVGAGTLAAGIQSGIGNVVGGSLFATMQSAAAGGAGAAVVNGVVMTGGATIAGGSGLAWVKSKLWNYGNTTADQQVYNEEHIEEQNKEDFESS
ncbi:hypothetical protein B7463_g9104, partial [Scytalidium lignicola]